VEFCLAVINPFLKSSEKEIILFPNDRPQPKANKKSMNGQDLSSHYTLIDTPAAVPALQEAITDAIRVSVDTEADSFHHFHHKVCLIQLATASRCFVVDPLAGLDLSPVLKLLAQKQLIFHDTGYDLRMLLADFDFRPQREIFDTMLAARLVGIKNISLSALLADILGIALPNKHNQRANWAQRPIPATLLAYAAEDIRHLERLADYLTERLIAQGRLDWHREYCQWTIAQTQQPKIPQDPDKAWRIRGTFGLPPRQLAFVRALWQWRQDQADTADVSPFRILHNEQLIELALWAERQKDIHSDQLPRLSRHCKGSHRRELLDALYSAARLGPEDWPAPPRREQHQKPGTAVLQKADRLKVECQQIADALVIEPQLIASRKALLAAVSTSADTEEKLLQIGWMRWQAQLLLPALHKILNHSRNDENQEHAE